MLELYHWEPNTFSLKCLITLHEKRLEFASRYVDFLALDQYALAPFAATEALNSIEGEAPVLVHDGRVIADSFRINLYLDEAFPPPPLQPADAAGRWRVLVWSRYFEEILAPAVCTLGCERYLATSLTDTERAALTARLPRVRNQERHVAWEALLQRRDASAAVDESLHKVRLTIRKVEAAFNRAPHGEWLAGVEYSLADIELFGLANTLPALTPEFADAGVAPHFSAWLQRMHARPAVRKALAMSRTGKPQQAFVPGPEHSRWG
jgi:glutathione S-transferase